jgi:metallophosphoesterase (TIGR00282 family)
MRILFVGDIVGKPGRQILARLLPRLRAEHRPDLVLANAENAAGGFGVTPAIGDELLALGIDLLTSGNHVWDKKEVEGYIAKEERLLRPANYPPEVPGAGVHVLERRGRLVGVLNLQGRVFMPTIDCPFRVGEREIEQLRVATPVVLVDFHAEATSEKQAFAWWVDGKVSAVLGTHTHVQTADERVLPGGTAYISDVGMTGSLDAVIGMEREQAIERFLMQLPRKFTAASANLCLCAVVVEVDEASGRATAIRRLQVREGE